MAKKGNEAAASSESGPLIRSFEERLGYRFSDPGLRRLALTHRSAGQPHNERLEFLGDAILGYLIADLLFTFHPTAREGTLTRIRASLVRKETLAEVGRELDLGPLLILGPGERKSGGRDRDSILADTVEAVLGAIYQDGGQQAVRDVVVRLFEHRVETTTDRSARKDPKTTLQEWLQSRRLALPAYRVHDVQGDAQHQVFSVECTINDLGLTAYGEGGSRRLAEQRAATALLKRIEDDTNDDGSG